MKWLVLSLLILAGCSSKEDSKCKDDLNKCVLVQSAWQLEQLDSQCKKLANCMKMEYEVLNFPDQSHNPYACAISKKEDGYTRSHYYYPKGEILFGEIQYERLKDAISTCEMMTRTGKSSKEYYNKLTAAFKAIDEERAKRKQAEEESRKPKPAVKVRVIK